MHLLSRFRRAAVVALVSAALIAPATRAQQAFLSFRAFPSGGGCAFDLTTQGSLVLAYLFVDKSLGITRISFGIPGKVSTPAGDLYYVGFDPPLPYAKLEYPDGTIHVIPPSCLTGTNVYLGQAYFLFLGPTGSSVCQPLQPIDLPGSPMQFTDCDGVVRRAGATPPVGWSCCDRWDSIVLSPWDPNPPDGATGVSLTPVLTWKHEGDDGPNPSWGMQVRLSGGGIDTTFVDDGGLFSQFVPPPLEPATTYTWSLSQWFVGNFESSTGGHSEWTFTTAPNVPVRTEPTTWGRVKALYRTP